MKNLTLLFTCCLVLIVACKDKDDDATSAPVPATDYFPLSQGSYWIYEWYRVDTLGNETNINKLDTLTITAKTNFNGEVYAVMEGTRFGQQVQYFYRDSSGFLLEKNSGSPILSTLPAIHLGLDTTWLEPQNVPLYSLEHFMSPDIVSTTVPAGSFDDCVLRTTIARSLDFTSEYGDRAMPYYFAKGVGLVKFQTVFFSAPDHFESRLVEYHINE